MSAAISNGATNLVHVEPPIDEKEQISKTEGSDGNSWLPLNPPVELGDTNTTSTSPNSNSDPPEERETNSSQEPTTTTAATSDESTSATSSPPKLYSMREVSAHSKPSDLWFAINNDVYDVTQFQHEHPGGPKIMSGVAGKDATKKFDKYHRRALLDRYTNLKVGILDIRAPELTAIHSRKSSFWQKLGIGKN